MDSSKPAIPARAPGRLPPSLTFAALQTAPASSPSSRRRERSSNTWTSSSADMALLSDTDDVDDRTCFFEEYNRLASKYGIRPLVPEVFDDTPSVAEVAPPGKKKWFSRKRDASSSRTTSGKSDKTLGHKASISDLHLGLGAQGKRESPKDKSLQTLVTLCGKSFFYLPTEYTPGCLIIPTCLRATGQYLAQNGPQEKGLFRVPGSVRAVNALYDYYCADNDGGGTISGTVRTPNLPSHLDFGVHDVASTFKKLLGGLPGGILGSLSVFDALVAIRGQLDGGLETNRTRQTRLRARLIALAIATLRSHYQRELVCAVFGLLCLVGRAAETAPREDDCGRPLPTSDLMGYNALGIIFGPLLVGGLIDRWSTDTTVPSAGPMHLHPALPPRKDRGKRRAISDGKRPVTPVTIDKILIANSIAEMVIANWRDVVRHLKSTNSTIHNDPALALPREAPVRALRSSASESALGTLSRRTRLEKSDESQETPSENLAIKKQRVNPTPRMVPFVRRTSPRLDSATGGRRKQNGDTDATEATPRVGRLVTVTSTPYVDVPDHHEATAVEPIQGINPPGLLSHDQPPTAHERASSGDRGLQSEASSKAGDSSTSVGILTKAHRALKAKLTSAAQRGSRSITPHSSGTIAKKESSSTEETSAKGPALKEPDLNREALLEQSSLKPSRQFTTTVRRAPRTSEAVPSFLDAHIDGRRDSRQHSSTVVVESVPATQVDEQAAKSMARKNATRQQHHPRQSKGAVRTSAELNEARPLAQPIAESQEERMNLGRVPHFHIEARDVAALRERGSPTRFHADTTVRMGRKLYTGCNADEYHPRKNRENRREAHDVKSEALTSTMQKTQGLWNDGEADDLRPRDQLQFQAIRHSHKDTADEKPATDCQGDAAVAVQIQEPATPRQSHLALSPGSAMLRTRASVSGGNVRAMAALFESVSKESQGGPSSPVQGAGGGGAAMTEYVVNATPLRTSRSSKSLRSGELFFPAESYGERAMGGGAGGQDGAGSEHDARQYTQPGSRSIREASADLIVPGASDVEEVSMKRAGNSTNTVGKASMPATEDVPMAQCLRKSRSRSTLGGESSPSRSRSPGTCLLHAQIRSLKMQLATKADECEKLRAELLARSTAAGTVWRESDSAAASLSSQLRWARQEAKAWRERAEAGERRLAAHDRWMPHHATTSDAPLYQQRIPKEPTAGGGELGVLAENAALAEAVLCSLRHPLEQQPRVPITNPANPQPLSPRTALNVNRGRRQLERRRATTPLRGGGQGGPGEWHVSPSAELQGSCKKENVSDSDSANSSKTTICHGQSSPEGSRGDEAQSNYARKVGQWPARGSRAVK
ncbi:hypothetical protein RB601_006604 [Gaeumannomyces tritici]